jgi:hypothetical protein
MVCALLGRSEDYRLLVALQPAYFCSWLAMAGATIKEIQELAGHKTITMSARYAQLSPDHKLSVIDRIASTATRPKARTATEKTNSHQNGHQQDTAIRCE